MGTRLRTTLVATAVAGTLDLASAFASGAVSGSDPLSILRIIASGPFGSAVRDLGAAGALVGLIIHYSIMLAMALAYVLAAERWPLLRAKPWAAGLAYGFLLYLVMYWIVLPLRWPGIHPSTDPATVGLALFSHIVCVGLPIALTTSWLTPIRPARA
jgi:hypothetical protein